MKLGKCHACKRVISSTEAKNLHTCKCGARTCFSCAGPVADFSHFYRQYKEKRKSYKQTVLITDEVVEELKKIVQEHPEYYLDEIADELLNATGKYISIPTIYQTLINKLEYSLRVCYESALQRDEEHRRIY